MGVHLEFDCLLSSALAFQPVPASPDHNATGMVTQRLGVVSPCYPFYWIEAVERLVESEGLDAAFFLCSSWSQVTL